ncbi:hypothetical protein EJ03DRAFT_109046 [Teratosphaeria nubilosa]|uniref:Uncharacterized protein n=1 Tax=Teratosphaeria nubilosa TaxID=161662 RepID=A0A6G1L8V3_9PEZI|nr:hypothetical protein EJ03DRAFT_109046 [Teratosphaeria nubilosa]
MLPELQATINGQSPNPLPVHSRWSTAGRYGEVSLCNCRIFHQCDLATPAIAWRIHARQALIGPRSGQWYRRVSRFLVPNVRLPGASVSCSTNYTVCLISHCWSDFMTKLGVLARAVRARIPLAGGAQHDRMLAALSHIMSQYRVRQIRIWC